MKGTTIYRWLSNEFESELLVNRQRRYDRLRICRKSKLANERVGMCGKRPRLKTSFVRPLIRYLNKMVLFSAERMVLSGDIGCRRECDKSVDKVDDYSV